MLQHNFHYNFFYITLSDTFCNNFCYNVISIRSFIMYMLQCNFCYDLHDNIIPITMYYSKITVTIYAMVYYNVIY